MYYSTPYNPSTPVSAQQPRSCNFLFVFEIPGEPWPSKSSMELCHTKFHQNDYTTCFNAAAVGNRGLRCPGNVVLQYRLELTDLETMFEQVDRFICEQLRMFDFRPWCETGEVPSWYAFKGTSCSSATPSNSTRSHRGFSCDYPIDLSRGGSAISAPAIGRRPVGFSSYATYDPVVSVAMSTDSDSFFVHEKPNGNSTKDSEETEDSDPDFFADMVDCNSPDEWMDYLMEGSLPTLDELISPTF